MTVDSQSKSSLICIIKINQGIGAKIYHKKDIIYVNLIHELEAYIRKADVILKKIINSNFSVKKFYLKVCVFIF